MPSVLKCHLLFAKASSEAATDGPSSQISARRHSSFEPVDAFLPPTPVAGPAASPMFPPAHEHQATTSTSHENHAASLMLDGITGLSISAQAKATSQNAAAPKLKPTTSKKRLTPGNLAARSHANESDAFPVVHNNKTILAAQTKSFPAPLPPVAFNREVHPFHVPTPVDKRPIVEASIGSHRIEHLSDFLGTPAMKQPGEHNIQRNALAFIGANKTPIIMVLNHQTNVDQAAKDLLAEHSSWTLVSAAKIDIDTVVDSHGLVSHVLITNNASSIWPTTPYPNLDSASALEAGIPFETVKKYLIQFAGKELAPEVTFEHSLMSTHSPVKPLTDKNHLQ